MHKEIKANETLSQQSCRLLYQERSLKELNLAQTYLELSNLIQASGKIQAADYCLYCYFLDKKNTTLAIDNLQCWVGLHIVGWDTGLQSVGNVKDFAQLDYQRFFIKTPSSPEDLLRLHETIVSENDLLLPANQWRLSCEFRIDGQSFEILSYIDFFSLVK